MLRSRSLFRWISCAAGAAVLLVAVGCAGPVRQAAVPEPAAAAPAPTDRLPDRLSSAEFWRLVTDISEPGGYFRIEDNYTSNEMEVGWIAGMLRAENRTGDVYLGVGPEQNFSYIAATRPRMAFVIDIRRQAVMQHLMFKAIFELADDRADFISLLFSKPRPAGIDSTTPIPRVWSLYAGVATDSAAWLRNYQRIVTQLTGVHGFTFTADESAKLRAVYDAFYYWGPSITTRGGPGGSGRGGAVNGDFARLTGWSLDESGAPRSFLSAEDDYRYVRDLHRRNLIVPVSGDFAGPQAIRAIGAWLTRRRGTVRAFYVSNVEQYLYGDGKAQAFYDNVRTLPIDTGSVFIRPYALRGRGGGPGDPLCPIGAFLRAQAEGRIVSDATATRCAL